MAGYFQIHPVGTVKRQNEKHVIEILPQYVDALLGLDQFSHILVFCWLHQNDSPEKRSVLQVHPRGDRRNPLSGVFATRSPVRPNLIGLSTCKVLSIRGNIINLDSIDAFDGTPVIDIKPCMSREDLVPEVRVPDWADR